MEGSRGSASLRRREGGGQGKRAHSSRRTRHPEAPGPESSPGSRGPAAELAGGGRGRRRGAGPCGDRPAHHSPHAVAQVLIIVVKQLEGVDLRAQGDRVRGRCLGRALATQPTGPPPPSPRPGLPAAVPTPCPPAGGSPPPTPHRRRGQGARPNGPRDTSALPSRLPWQRPCTGMSAASLRPPGQAVPAGVPGGGGGGLTSVSGFRFLMMGFSRTDRWCW